MLNYVSTMNQSGFIGCYGLLWAVFLSKHGWIYPFLHAIFTHCVTNFIILLVILSKTK